MGEIIDIEPADENDSINSLRRFEIDSIARVGELGMLNFTEIVPSLAVAQKLYQKLTPDVWRQLPPDLRTTVRNLATQLWNLVVQTKSFSPNQQNPKGERDGLISQISSYVTASLQQLSWLSLLENDGTENQRLATLVANAESEFQRVTKLTADAQNALSIAKEAAAQSGVNAQVSHFGKASDDDEALATKWFGWLWKSACGVAGLALFFVVLAFWGVGTTNTPAAIQFASAKIILFAVVSYAVLLCARQYSAAKHNATINRHKQLSLRTFDSFVAGSKADEVRDAVLLKAATAVFEHQDTGYLKQSVSQTGSLQNVIELVTARHSP